MICEILGAVQCLAICVVNFTASAVGPEEMIAGLWVLGIGGMSLAAKNGTG